MNLLAILKEELNDLYDIKEQYDYVMNTRMFAGRMTGKELVCRYGDVNPKFLGVRLRRELRDIRSFSNINEQIAKLQCKINKLDP